MKKLKLLNGTLIFLLAAGGACVAQSDQPSLGDLAKEYGVSRAAIQRVQKRPELGGRTSISHR